MNEIIAFTKINELLVLLIDRVKDRQTAALVQQIQAQQLVVHNALMVANTKIADLDAENRKLKAQLDEESGPPNPGRLGRGF